MATEKAPTKADVMAALEKKGIKNLDDLIDAVMPEPDETGGYHFYNVSGGDPYDDAVPGLNRREQGDQGAFGAFQENEIGGRIWAWVSGLH